MNHAQTFSNRRAFFRDGALVLSAMAATLADRPARGEATAPALRIGLMTDLHYADKSPAGTRHYRETLDKLAEAGELLRGRQPDFLVELGDLIDAAADVEVERRYLRTINAPFSQIAADRHYVLGNHCVDTLTKPEFLAEIERERSYYSFDRGDFHFIVLDSCFRGDGEPYGRRNFQWTDPNVPPAELQWLRGDLAANTKPTVVFVHQRLDVTDNHGVKNAAQVRELLEASGNVLAVFQGHSHKNDLKQIGQIFYCTLVAMVEGSGAENSGYALASLFPGGEIRIEGFRRQSPYQWPA